MTNRAINAHAPALTMQEAAMLPALQRMPDAMPAPKNLLVSHAHLDFRPVEAAPGQATVPSPRRGSSAGRAILRAAGVTLPGAAAYVRGK